jgi:hypothetical protein
MSKRKGLSLEEKRQRVLEVFTESADVFVLKVGGRLGGHHTHAARTRPCLCRQLSRSTTHAKHAPPGPPGYREAGLQARRGAAEHQGGAAGGWLGGWVGVAAAVAATLQPDVDARSHCLKLCRVWPLLLPLHTEPGRRQHGAPGEDWQR